MAVPDVPLYSRVEQQVSRLAHEMLDRFVVEIPIYAVLPREQLEGEILAITDHNLRLFFSALHTGRSLTDDELAEMRISAARRAEERVPLDAVLAAYHVGGRMGWEALVAAAEPEESEALVVAAGRVLAYVQQVTGAVAAAYLEERQSIYGEERDAVRALASALLAGEPADALAARVGVAVAPSYVVLTMRIGDHPDEGDRGVGGAVAARRKVRRVQGCLDEWAGEPVVGLLDPGGGTALIAATQERLGEVLAGLDTLSKELQGAAGADVVCAVAVAATQADLAHAAAQAEEILRLAVELERPPGVYNLHDVLLEYQLTADSDAQSALAGLLDPLDRNPDLVLTLETYLAHDLDRRSTAAALHVHPNTLDYRVKRIVDLTGVDPAKARGLQLLAAAVVSRRRHTAG